MAKPETPHGVSVELEFQKQSMTLKIISVFGTRPEAIKMAPVIQAIAARSDMFDSKVCVTAQHRSLLDQTLQLFGIVPDYDLNIMVADQSPTQVTAAVLSKLEPILAKQKPDWVLVQGDTTTTAAAAIAAFHAGSKVAHVEAGLRTHDKLQPFPEEINRRIVSLVADLHFAASEAAQLNLVAEGIPARRIVVTGNPVIDALQLVLRREPPPEIACLLNGIKRIKSSNRLSENRPANDDRSSGSAFSSQPPKLILVTAHRRENFGRPLENICNALRAIATSYDGQVKIIYPVHPNPNVREPVSRFLDGCQGITLTPPLDYLSLAHVAQNCHLILTDSGGLQEEGASLGKPVLVMRNLTDRPETIAAGTARVVGTETETIVAEVSRLLDDERAYQSMGRLSNIYGDGQAGERILQALLNFRQ